MSSLCNGGSRQRPDTSTLARAAAVAIEDRIRYDALESGFFISPAGVKLLAQTGQADHVSFSIGDLRRARGTTFTHNHPRGNGFSVDDLELAADFGFEEVRVVTPVHRFWARRLGHVQTPRLRLEYDAALPQVRQLLDDEVKRGVLNLADYGYELTHCIWHRVASTLGFEYCGEPS